MSNAPAETAANRRDPRWADLRDPVMLLALGFGSGLVPRAPGTAGSALGVVLFCILVPLAWPLQALVHGLLIGCGIPLCGVAACRLGEPDHSAIVWDELACVPPVLLAVSPWGVSAMGLAWVLFRGFDALKPWPVGWLDRRLTGGWGVMADDIAAGLLAALVVVAGGWLLG
jgi:phosphatidylglycerophosphatase A